MTCEAEKKAPAEILKHLHSAEDDVQQEKLIAEEALLRSEMRIHDWRAVRLAVALVHTWDAQYARAEAALEQCKKRAQKSVDSQS